MTISALRTTAPLPPVNASAEARIEALREELEAGADRARQAVLQYEIGHATEHALGNEAQAVREYLAAYNLDPTFRPPLIALVSIFERRRSFKNLLRLYEAEARGAATPREAASALADRAVLMADQLGEPGEARQLLESAFEQAGEADDIALLLETQLLATGEREAALEVIAQRAELVRDPVLATLLRLEVARAKEDDGDIDGALSVLRNAVTTPAARWRVLEQLERVARRAGRQPERIVALEGRAKLAAAEARGEDQGQASGAFSVQRFADQARAGAEAAALYREAARLRIAELGDPAGARRDYDAAIALRADDPLLRYERMLACELADDRAAAAEEAQRLLDFGVEGPPAAALHFRLAEHAQSEGDAEGALAHMRDAQAADPESTVVSAMLEDLLRGHDDLPGALAHLAARAAQAEGEVQAQRAWDAAQLAADGLSDFAAAAPLFQQAAEAAKDPTPILREMAGAALRLGDADGARTAIEALLARLSEPDSDEAGNDEADSDEAALHAEERSALLRDLHELLRMVLADTEAADQLLERALDDRAAETWAPDLARVHGALSGNAALAAKAHLALGARASDAETAAAHFAAAARMQIRGGQDDAAIDSLRRALERSPTHPYAVALLEEVLRARGDAEELVRLLKEAAERSDAPRAAEQRLLLAGAEAEASGDVDKAVQTYEEAAERDPTSLAPPLAIKRLAESRKDRALLLKALEMLSAREIAAGAPGRHTLALGEHYDLLSGKPEEAEATLRTALGSDTVGLMAAVDLALLPHATDDARLAGLAQLLERAPGDAALLRVAAAAAIEADPALAEARVKQLRDQTPRDVWAHLALLRLSASDSARAGERADAWLGLGHATDDPDASAELLLHGLRATMVAKGAEGIDDGVILAHEVAAALPGSLSAAVALDETLSAGDDPEGRADALGSWLGHAGDAGRLALDSAHGRALAAAGRSREALEVLLRVAAQEGDDLASWEAIRVCARECEAWEPLVEACDRLAHLIEDDELAAMLLEESAAVLMDELGQDARAERRLRRVLAIDAKRPIAYGRFHDLLAERGDDAGLLELVSARIDLVDDPEELSKLFYEQARLYRALGMREDALATLDNLLMLDGEHLGGLALLVELLVQNEDWAGAVEALHTLAVADETPDSQRRIARLGAADFLQHKLDDPEGALEELAGIDAIGLADRAIHERMATLATTLERFDDAAAALAKAAAASSTPTTIARIERLAGALHADQRDDRKAAIAAYERALEAVPTDLEASTALAALLDLPGRVGLSQRFEEAVRAELEADPSEPSLLRRLRHAARWRDDRALDMAVLSALVSLGLSTDEELSELAAFAPGRARPSGSLDRAGFDSLRAPGDGEPALSFAALLAESVAELDGLEPATFGLSKGDLVPASDPLRAEIAEIAAALGVAAPELWRGGDHPSRIDVMPHHKGKPAFVLGPAVTSPLLPVQRFQLARLAAGLRLGVAPFVRRDPASAATALYAAAAAAEVPLASGEGRKGMAETTRKLQKLMPRRVRKAAGEQARALGDGRALHTWAGCVHRTADRAGLLLAGDLTSALRALLGEAPDRDSLLSAPDALDLYVFGLSPEALALRRRLGLSK